MSLILWEHISKTDHDEIDHQHQRMLESINTLRVLHQRGQQAAIAIALDDIAVFLQQHFAFEERLMHDSDYAYLEPHEIANKLFLKKLARFQQRFAAQEDMFEEMHASLTRWIGFHIHMMNRQ